MQGNTERLSSHKQAPEGWVYVVTSKALPDLVTVGSTTRTDINQFIAEFDHAGLPYPYELAFKVWVPEPHVLTQSVHQVLDIWRENRDWFRCSAERVQYAIELLLPDHTKKWKRTESSAEPKDFSDTTWPGYSEAPNAPKTQDSYSAWKLQRGWAGRWSWKAPILLLLVVAVVGTVANYGTTSNPIAYYVCLQGYEVMFKARYTAAISRTTPCRNGRYLGQIIRSSRQDAPWAMTDTLRNALRIPRGGQPGFVSEGHAKRFIKGRLTARWR